MSATEKIVYKTMLFCCFCFCFVFSISQGIDQFDDIGPSVVMASPGMMQVHYLFIYLVIYLFIFFFLFIKIMFLSVSCCCFFSFNTCQRLCLHVYTSL